MAKLTNTATVTPGPVSGEPNVPLAGTVPAAGEPVAAAPFSVQPIGGGAVSGSQPNVVERRAEKIKAVVDAGKPFTYSHYIENEAFSCICGASGKNAHVVKDKAGAEVKVGTSCLKYMRGANDSLLTPPKKERKAREGGTPGVSRQQKMQDGLSKFVAPFSFSGKQDGPFSCICGGKGSKQIVIKDANGATFSVGETCAKQIPGVELPKAESKRVGKQTAKGLKGGVATTTAQSAPTFGSVG